MVTALVFPSLRLQALCLGLSCMRLAAQWTDVSDPPTVDIRGMRFFDATTGVVCGAGSIQRTTDGGDTWTEVASFGGLSTDLDFTPDGIHGICGLDSGRVLVSHDAGLTWAVSSVPGTIAYAWQVDIVDSLTLFADMQFESTWRSMDGGTTWAPAGIPYFQEMVFLDDTLGFYCSQQEVFRTEDGGATWEVLSDDFPETLQAIVFTDPLHGWVAGRDGYVARTVNGGFSWLELYNDDTTFINLYCIDVNGSLGISGGSPIGGTGPILYTEDGQNWMPGPFEFPTSAWGCSVPTPAVAYICSYQGDLWRYELSTGVASPSAESIGVFPVPSGEELFVRAPSDARPTWRWVLLDPLGRVVLTRPVASPVTVLPRGGAASGVYTVCLQDGDHRIAVERAVFR